MRTLTAALLLREYAQEDELRADDDEKYGDGGAGESLRRRAREAVALAAELDPEGASA